MEQQKCNQLGSFPKARNEHSLGRRTELAGNAETNMHVGRRSKQQMELKYHWPSATRWLENCMVTSHPNI